MFVACSTLCFRRLSLEDALGLISEMEFSKFEAGLHEKGGQMRPFRSSSDIGRAAARCAIDPA